MTRDARDIEKDLALCEKRTPGPVKWQKFGKQYYLTGQYGIRPIIFSTLDIEREGCVKEVHISNRDAENDLLIPLNPNHPDSRFVEEAWEALPYYIEEVEILRAENQRLREALQVLLDEQCGVPLIRRTTQYYEAVRKARKALEVRNG